MNHLTDDQLDDLLIGDAPADSHAHFDACPRCTARLNAIQSPMASFNAASLAWGERRSATLPLLLQPKPAGLFNGGRLRLAVGALGTAAATIFALALALPLLHHGPVSEAAHQAALPSAPVQTIQTAALPATATPDTDSAQPQTPEQQQIARDNQLLQAIDRELATTETPAELLKMTGQRDVHQSSPDATHNE